METPGAAFLTMIMDRLQTVEEQNTQMKRVIEELQPIRDALLFTLHVRPGDKYKTFSDGMAIIWRIGDVPTMSWHPRDFYYPGTPLDDVHENATMFFGMKTLVFMTHEHYIEKKLSISIGQSGIKTTFGSFFRQVNNIVNEQKAFEVFAYARGRQYKGLHWETTLADTPTLCVSKWPIEQRHK